MYKVKILKEDETGKELNTDIITIRKKVRWEWRKYKVDALIATGVRGGKYYIVHEKNKYWMGGRGKEVWGVYREYATGYFRRTETISENEIEYVYAN